jgi:hypothetical protein
LTEKYSDSTPLDSQYEVTPTTATSNQGAMDFPEEEIVYIDHDSIIEEDFLSGGTELMDIPQKEFLEHKKQIQADIDAANKYLGKHGQIGMVVLPTYSYLIRIAIGLNWLDEWNADALCIDRGRKIIVEV